MSENEDSQQPEETTDPEQDYEDESEQDYEDESEQDYEDESEQDYEDESEPTVESETTDPKPAEREPDVQERYWSGMVIGGAAVGVSVLIAGMVGYAFGSSAAEDMWYGQNRAPVAVIQPVPVTPAQPSGPFETMPFETMPVQPFPMDQFGMNTPPQMAPQPMPPQPMPPPQMAPQPTPIPLPWTPCDVGRSDPSAVIVGPDGLLYVKPGHCYPQVTPQANPGSLQNDMDSLLENMVGESGTITPELAAELGPILGYYLSNPEINNLLVPPGNAIPMN